MTNIDRCLIGLSSYADLFAANEIDLATLPHLGDSDLKELGLPVGPYKNSKVELALVHECWPLTMASVRTYLELRRQQMRSNY